jgi:hypothetical protein
VDGRISEKGNLRHVESVLLVRSHNKRYHLQRFLIAFTALAIVAGTGMSACTLSPTEVPAVGQATPTTTLLAQDGSPTPALGQGNPEAVVPSEVRRVVELAKEDLARRLELSLSEIAAISIEAVDWPDTSLGCPQPGTAYAQVITPGFRIVLGAAGQTYEYHTDEDSSVVLCPKGMSDL